MGKQQFTVRLDEAQAAWVDDEAERRDRMTTDGPRGYDREFIDAVGGSARRRLAYSHDRGEITRFVVQLEYRLNSWQPVVRFDHDPASD